MIRRFPVAGVYAAGLVAGGLAAQAALAHHALEALYDTGVERTSTVTLVKVDWINPHAWMRVDIRHLDGHVEPNIQVETLGLGSLRQLGISKETLLIGAEYVITYYPNRDGSPGGYVTRLTLPGGTLIGTPRYDGSDSGG